MGTPTPRHRPGSYAWPEQRRDAEAVWAGGGGYHDGEAAVLAYFTRPVPGMRAPSGHTIRRWWRERRWLTPRPSPPRRRPAPGLHDRRPITRLDRAQRHPQLAASGISRPGAPNRPGGADAPARSASFAAATPDRRQRPIVSRSPSPSRTRRRRRRSRSRARRRSGAGSGGLQDRDPPQRPGCGQASLRRPPRGQWRRPRAEAGARASAARRSAAYGLTGRAVDVHDSARRREVDDQRLDRVDLIEIEPDGVVELLTGRDTGIQRPPRAVESRDHLVAVITDQRPAGREPFRNDRRHVVAVAPPRLRRAAVVPAIPGGVASGRPQGEHCDDRGAATATTAAALAGGGWGCDDPAPGHAGPPRRRLRRVAVRTG